MSKHIHTEISIDAAPADVWDVLADLASYEDWNPYHVEVHAGAPLVPGSRLVVHISKPNGEAVRIKPHVIRIEPGRELTWGGGIRGIFRGEHRFLLEPVDGRTRLIHSEDFTGFAVRFADLEAIEEGYQLMNEALKERVEAGIRGVPNQSPTWSRSSSSR